MSVYFLPDRDEGQLDWVNGPFHSLLSEKMVVVRFKTLTLMLIVISSDIPTPREQQSADWC